MKFVKATTELIPHPDPMDRMEVLKFLERIGRVCYKSEERITDKSCVEFLMNLRVRKHWAMLEHYIFTIAIPEGVYHAVANLIREVNEENPDLGEKIRYIRITRWDDPYEETIKDRRFLLSASATALNYLWACSFFQENPRHAVVRLCNYMYYLYPELIQIPENTGLEYNFGDLDEFRLLGPDEVEQLPIGLRTIHDWMTFKWTTDRGVSHECVRHRPMSFAQESTRYCNYGKLGCTFTIPPWIQEYDQEVLLDPEKVAYMSSHMDSFNPYSMSGEGYVWWTLMKQAADGYEKMLNQYHWTPQQARSVLPTETKTEIIVTGNFAEWKHLFNMRIPKSAHPQMRELAIPTFQTAYRKHLTMFQDQSELIRECYVDAV